MNRKVLVSIAILLITILIALPPVSAASNVTAYGDVLGVYSNTSGNATLEVRTNIPLTVEDVAYPDWLFITIAAIGMIFLVSGIWFIARPEDVPIIAMLASGFITFGCYTACAIMAPLVAKIEVAREVVAGGATGVDSIYVTQTVTYLLSPWVGIACWGVAIAGGIIAIAAALSWAGYLDMKGLKAASEGRYLETDMPTGQQDESSLAYKRLGNGKAKR